MRPASAVAAFLLTLTPLTASAQWRSLRSDHFQLIGNASARELRDVALRFEQFREILRRLDKARTPEEDEAPVTILVFRDDRSFAPFMPRVNDRRLPAAGMFVKGPDTVYIAVRLNNADSFRVVFHEYSHLLLRRTFPNPPLWFNEGLAEYYSTLRVGGSRSAVIGAPVPAHVRLLRQRSMPLAKLFAATEDSPEYTDATANRLVLYAQAWALVHHAFHGQPRRADQLMALAVKLAAGGGIEESVRAAYGVPLSDVEREVQAYVLQDSYQAVAFNFREDFVTRLTPEPALISDAEAEAWLGDLLAQMGRDDEARLRLEGALTRDPGLARAQAALERLLRRQNPTRRGFTGLNTVAPLEPGARPFLRITLADERRTFGTLEALDCNGELVDFVLQTSQGTVRARTRFGDVQMISYRQTLGDVLCGPQPSPLPTLLTWKQAPGDVARAIAVEFVPEGFVP